MRRSARGMLFLLALALGFTGCAIPVYTDHDTAADFASLRSFAWLDPPLREAPLSEGAPPTDPFTHNSLLDKRVREAVSARLAERGYREAGEGEKADFLLRYEVVSREVIRSSPVYGGVGYGAGTGRYGYGADVYYPDITSYQEGTLILDVIDPTAESLAWRGWAASRTRDGHIDAERVSKTVDAILARFPPKSE